MHSDDIDFVMRIKGFADCELGACKTWDNGRLVTRMIYDGEKMIAKIMEEFGETWEEASESVSSRVVAHYCGDATPIVLVRAIPIGGVH